MGYVYTVSYSKMFQKQQMFLCSYYFGYEMEQQLVLCLVYIKELGKFSFFPY